MFFYVEGIFDTIFIGLLRSLQSIGFDGTGQSFGLNTDRI